MYILKIKCDPFLFRGLRILLLCFRCSSNKSHGTRMSKKRFLLSVIFVCLWVYFSFAQTSTSRIEKLVGGHVQFNGQVAGSSLSFLHSGRFTTSNQYLAWMDFYRNPAFSTGIKNPSVAYFFAPAISIHPNRFTDVNGRARTAVNNGISSYRSDSLRLAYPQIESVFRTNRFWGQGLVNFPAGGMVFTFGYQNQLLLQLRALLTGAEATITTEVPMSETTSKVVFNAFLDANFRFNLYIDRITLGAAKVIRNRFAIGFSLDRYGADVNAVGFMDSQGDMLFNGHEYIFNNPNDNWHNTLTQSIAGTYKGSGWGMNWGGWYVFNRHFLFDGLISLQTAMKLNGNLSLHLNKIPALNINALSSNDPNAEILDPAKLNLSQLTLTDSVKNPTYPKLFLNQQSFLKIGALYQSNNFYWYNSYAQNFGYAGLEYGSYELGLRSVFDWQSLLGFRHFYLESRLRYMKSFVHKSEKLGKGESRLWLPSFAFGYGRLFRSHFPFQVNLSVLPEPAFYFSTGYQF